jgi:hypothetical protein
LPTSLMPAGLDHALSEEELLDLVAYLRSCKSTADRFRIKRIKN